MYAEINIPKDEGGEVAKSVTPSVVENNLGSNPNRVAAFDIARKSR